MSYHFRVLKKKYKNLKIPCNKIHQVTSPFPLTQTFFFENKKNKHFESEAKMIKMKDNVIEMSFSTVLMGILDTSSYISLLFETNRVCYFRIIKH